MMNATDLTSFREQVYAIARQVPPGEVATYGQIAALIPSPAGIAPPDYVRVRAQWAGRAMSNAPEGVPWHRVVNSRGQISLPPGSREAAIQRSRLQAEGIEFDRNGRVDLEKFGWAGPPETWTRQHDLCPPPPAKPRGPTQLELL